MKVKTAIYGIIACTAALQVNEAFAYDPVMGAAIQLMQMSQPGYNQPNQYMGRIHNYSNGSYIYDNRGRHAGTIRNYSNGSTIYSGSQANIFNTYGD